MHTFNNLFGNGTQCDGVLDIGCNMFILNILALRPCLLQRYNRPSLRGLHLMMITYTCYPKYIFFGDLILVYTFMVITIFFLKFGQAQGSGDLSIDCGIFFVSALISMIFGSKILSHYWEIYSIVSLHGDYLHCVHHFFKNELIILWGSPSCTANSPT
jgi:hypothetical protein